MWSQICQKVAVFDLGFKTTKYSHTFNFCKTLRPLDFFKHVYLRLQDLKCILCTEISRENREKIVEVKNL